MPALSFVGATLPALRPALFAPASRRLTQDSGGPLWQLTPGSDPLTFTQYAIVSSAMGSPSRPCDSKWPTVFMRTSYYWDWIAEVTGGGLA